MIFDEANPSVGLLNVGSEEIKGHETLKNAFAQLSEAKNNFIFKGYVEGNQIKDGNVDVIVTDGFSGNIALKTAEGTANYITTEIKIFFQILFLVKFVIYLVFQFLKKLKIHLIRENITAVYFWA